MFDTKTAAQNLAAKGVAHDQAEAIAESIAQAAMEKSKAADPASQTLLSRSTQGWIAVFGFGIAVGGLLVSIATWKIGLDAKFAHLRGSVDSLVLVAAQNSNTLNSLVLVAAQNTDMLNSLVRAARATAAEQPDQETDAAEQPDQETDAAEQPDQETDAVEQPDQDALLLRMLGTEHQAAAQLSIHRKRCQKCHVIR